MQAAPGGVIAAQATVSVTDFIYEVNESASKMSSQNLELPAANQTLLVGCGTH